MDLVERKDAILCLDDDIYIEGKENAEAVADYVNRVRKRLDKLPAHEKDEWCTDCKEYDYQKHYCPRFCRVIRKTVEELKSEQPEIIRCGDCRYWKNDHLCECLSKYGTFETEIYFYCGFAERRTE